MKRALVTGGAGFIGAALVRHLLESGRYATVVVLDNLVTNPSGVPDRCEFIHGDTRESDDVACVHALGPFDELYHFAASFANELSVNFPRIDFASNALGTLNLLTELKNAYGLFVYAGSSSSYGPSQGRAFREDDPLHPGTPYALSKHVGEEYVRLLAPRYVVHRFFNVFGPGDAPGRWRNALPNMLCRARLTGTFMTFGEEQGAGRDFTYIDDVVQAVAASDRIEGNTVYNLCSGEPTLIADIARQVAEWTDASPIRKAQRAWDKVVTRWGENTRIREQLRRAGVDDTFRTFTGPCVMATFEWLDDYVRRHESDLRRWLE